MAVPHVNIRFSGYWSDFNIGLMPRRPGLFCVYRARFDDLDKTTTMLELLHVGASANVHQSVSHHRDHGRWRTRLGSGESLSFSFGSVAEDDLAACELAMLMRHRPPLSGALPDSFPFGGMTVSLDGRTPLLDRQFTVGTATVGGFSGRGSAWLRRGIERLRTSVSG